MRRTYLILALLIALSAVAAALVMHGQKPIAPATTTADVGAPFSLTDQDGRTVTDRDFHGRVMLLAFGYTGCPDICPMQLGVMRAALDQLGDKARHVAPVFVTLDPAHDTPERLRDYLRAYKGDKQTPITALTGPLPQIDTLADSYHVYVKRTPEPKAPDILRIDHSLAIFLMDSNGAFVQSFTDPAPGEIAAAIANII